MSTRTRSSLLLPLLLSLAALSSPSRAARAAAEDDPMAPYRERFKAGMERYKAGDLPAAISAWEAIYREVGPDRGYRVAFDLARAYEKSGDAPDARDRYQSFLQIVQQRRASGLPLEPVVVQEETEARARLDELPPPKPTEPAPAAPSPPPPVSSATPAAAESPAAVPAPPPAPAPVSPARPPQPPTSQPPFSPLLLVATGGATIAAITLCAVEYANALSEENAFRAASAQPSSVQSNLKSTYDGTVPIAYASLGASIGLAAITAGLTAWYFAGTKPRDARLSPSVAPLPGGAQVGLVGRF